MYNMYARNLYTCHAFTLYKLSNTNFYVCNLFTCHTLNKSQGSMCIWIHHWVILQFLHQFFVVGRNTVLPGPDEDNNRTYIFKNDNWSTMIKAVDRKFEDKHVRLCNYRPRFSLVWLGFTPRPRMYAENSEDNTYKLAAGLKEKRLLKTNKRKVGHKKSRDTKRKRK
jgi:hypothetical protein